MNDSAPSWIGMSGVFCSLLNGMVTPGSAVGTPCGVMMICGVEVIEREQGFPEQREAEHAVDLHAEVIGQIVKIVRERPDALEARRAELQAFQDDRIEQLHLAVGAPHPHRRLVGRGACRRNASPGPGSPA